MREGDLALRRGDVRGAARGRFRGPGPYRRTRRVDWGGMDAPLPETAPWPEFWWPGHATVSVRMDGVHVVTDPLLRNWLGPIRRRRGSVDVRAFGHVDAVLISHLHHDHLDLASLRRLGRETPVIVPEGAGAFVRKRGFPRVEELAHGATLHIGPVRVTAVPAVHTGARLLGPKAATSGYLIDGSRTVYFAGDTARFAGMRELRGGVDVALLPVGGWGPTLGEEGHMDWRAAAQGLVDIEPSMAVPIHWGTFWPLGLEWLRPEYFFLPGPRFGEQAARVAPGVDVRVLAPGERLHLDGHHDPNDLVASSGR